MKDRRRQSRTRFLWRFIGLLWIIEGIDLLLLGGALDQYGLWPGDWSRWEGILLMTFLHGNLYHLLSNTIGLAVFGTLLITKSWRDISYASVGAILGCGLAVMFLGQPGSVHIGASGLVFGWWSFLIARAFYQRDFKSIFVAVLVIFFFGGMIYGVLQGQSGISWQGHLGGAIGGIIGAWLMVKKFKG